MLFKSIDNNWRFECKGWHSRCINRCPFCDSVPIFSCVSKPTTCLKWSPNVTLCTRNFIAFLTSMCSSKIATNVCALRSGWKMAASHSQTQCVGSGGVRAFFVAVSTARNILTLTRREYVIRFRPVISRYVTFVIKFIIPYSIDVAAIEHRTWPHSLCAASSAWSMPIYLISVPIEIQSRAAHKSITRHWFFLAPCINPWTFAKDAFVCCTNSQYNKFQAIARRHNLLDAIASTFLPLPHANSFIEVQGIACFVLSLLFHRRDRAINVAGIPIGVDVKCIL